MLAWWLSVFRGSRSILLGNSIFCEVLRGGGGGGLGSGPPVPPLDPPICKHYFLSIFFSVGGGGIAPECQSAWVRTVCKDHRLMTKLTASRQRVNLCVYIHTSTICPQWRAFFTSNGDSYEMPNDAAFHLGLHYL